MLVFSGFTGFFPIALASSLAPVPAPTPSAPSWHTMGSVQGIPTIEITEPSWTLYIANSSQPYVVNGVGYSYELFDTRHPLVNLTAGAIGNAPFWTETIGCGCGSGSDSHIYHVGYQDNNVYMITSNFTSTAPSSQPNANFTYVFYRGTDWFTWEAGQSIRSNVTGLNGYDMGISIAPASTFACLGPTGTVATGRCDVPFSPNVQKSLGEFQFISMGNYGHATDNLTVSWYPIYSSTGYADLATGTEGRDMKISPFSSLSSASSFGLTWNATASNFKSTVTTVVYIHYDDLHNYAADKALAKSLYLGYGANVPFDNSGGVLYCSGTLVNAQGGYCNTKNPANFIDSSIVTGYSTYNEEADNSGYTGWSLRNATGSRLIGTGGGNYGGLKIYSPCGLYPDESLCITNSTSPGRFGYNGGGNGFYGRTVGNRSGIPYIQNRQPSGDVNNTITVTLPSKTSDKYIMMDNMSVSRNTTITTASIGFYMAADSGDNFGWITGARTTALNSTFYDYDFRAIDGTWYGFVVGVYGHNTWSSVSFASSCSANTGCRITAYLINNPSPQPYAKSQKFGGAFIIWPHHGMINSTSQITSVRNPAPVAISPVKEAYTRPINQANATGPLSLEDLRQPLLLLYTNSTTTGFDALMAKQPGNHTSHFLWNSTLGGKLTSVAGVATSWSQSVITGALSDVMVHWAVKGNDSLIEFNTAPKVTVILTCKLAGQGGPAETFALSGVVFPSPTSGQCSGAGSLASVTADSLSTLTVTVQADTPNARYRGNSSWTAGTSYSYTPTASGNQSILVYNWYQLRNDYEAVASNPATWDGNYAIQANGTYLGTGSFTQPVGEAADGGRSVSASLWYDYGMRVGLSPSFADTFSGTWLGIAPISFTDTTGGNSHAVGYSLAAQIVSLPISCTIAQPGVPSTSFTVTGGTPTPSPVTIECTSSGATSPVAVQRSASVTLTVPPDGPDTRFRIESGAPPGVTSASTATCAAGLCPAWRVVVTYQVQSKLQAVPMADSVWDANYAIQPTGTVGGVPGTMVCTINAPSGTGTASCNAWSDYGGTVTFPFLLGGSAPGARRAAPSVFSFSPTSGGNTESVDYYYLLQNTYQVNPGPTSSWDSAYTLAVTGTVFGSAGQTGCNIVTTKGGGAAWCVAYFDFNSTVSLPELFNSQTTGTGWAGRSPANFTQTTGGNVDIVNYALVSTVSQSPGSPTVLTVVLVAFVLVVCLFAVWLVLKRRTPAQQTR